MNESKGNDAVGVNMMLIMYVKSLGPLNVYNNEKPHNHVTTSYIEMTT